MGWLGKLFGTADKKEAAAKMEPAVMKEQVKEAATMAKDPVCGMAVSEKTAPAKSDYQGKTYYFCALGCKKTFDANPDKYTGNGGQEAAGHGSHRM